MGNQKMGLLAAVTLTVSLLSTLMVVAVAPPVEIFTRTLEPGELPVERASIPAEILAKLIRELENLLFKGRKFLTAIKENGLKDNYSKSDVQKELDSACSADPPTCAKYTYKYQTKMLCLDCSPAAMAPAPNNADLNGTAEGSNCPYVSIDHCLESDPRYHNSIETVVTMQCGLCWPPYIKPSVSISVSVIPPADVSALPPASAAASNIVFTPFLFLFLFPAMSLVLFHGIARA